ncbi:acetylglutamate kinase [Bacillus salitolerans]|uniref:Acetylglutamate kinase n=1 Tax=Bacillus salitolerans TaxID=1437434 RepID=A0ABW4LX14_9BACI
MKYLVIKCGGSVMEQLPSSFYEDIVDLHVSGEWMPIIVHGGGPLISTLLKTNGIETKFVDGLRVTTEEVLDVVEMVLSGTVNKQIVRRLLKHGGKAFGISGVDGTLLKTIPTTNHHELGFVGEVAEVNKNIIETIIDAGFIPVISPVGIDEEGQRYNINGDIAASAVAKALGGSMCMISDIPGIYTEVDGEKFTLNKLTKKEVEKLIDRGMISGGMVPKVKAAIDGLVHQVPEVVIINGMEPNSLKRFTEGNEIGTKIVLDEECLHVH